MPGVPGEPRGDYARVVLFFPTRDCGCNGHPAFPAPSVCFRAQRFCTTRADSRRENAEVCVGRRGCNYPPSLRGATATKQSSFLACGAMDCFAGARNDGMEALCAVSPALIPPPLWGGWLAEG